MMEIIENNVSGIYCIENMVNGKRYIGSSKNIKKRWNFHKYEFENNKHSNDHFQKSYNKYGLNEFFFYIIEECDSDRKILDEKERYYVNFYDTRDSKHGYNLTDGGLGTKGKFVSKEVREKMSRKGKIVSEKTRAKISAAGKGRIVSKETREKISKAQIGRIYSKEFGEASSKRQKGIPRPNRQGIPHSKEHSEAISMSKIGKKHGKNREERHVGVYFMNKHPNYTKPWMVNITIAPKIKKHVGYFSNEKDAIVAYENAYFKYFGKQYNENESEE